MDKVQVEAEYKSAADPLLKSFQDGQLSFQEWARRHSELCSAWRAKMSLALERERECLPLSSARQ